MDNYRKMIISDDNDDLEYKNEDSYFVDVFYKGEPFTGKLTSASGEMNYVNGNSHGALVDRYENGKIKVHEVYENGEFISGEAFYPSGAKMSEYSERHSRYWNLQGNIVSEFDGKTYYHFFTNGLLKSISHVDKSENWDIKYYTKNGKNIYTQVDKWVGGNLKRKIEYDDDLMFENFFELLNFENPELKDAQSYSMAEGHRIHHIWMWFWEVFEKDARSYLNIANKLLTHPDEGVKQVIANIIASHKFHDFIEQENEKNKIAYSFIRESTKYHDERDPNRSTKSIKL